MIVISSDSNSCFSWRNSLVIIHAVLGFFSVWYCKLVYWNAAEVCYVIPCYEGPGLEELWKVNKGTTFTGESSGVFAVMHAALGYALFTGSSNESSSLLEHAHFVVGIFAGITFCASLLSLNMVYVWGAETNLLLNLSKLKETNMVFEESGRHMVVNHSLTETFFRLSTVSSFMCFFQLCVLVQLLMARREFTRYFRILVSGGEETMGTLAQNSESMPLRPMGATTTTTTTTNNETGSFHSPTHQRTLMV